MLVKSRIVFLILSNHRKHYENDIFMFVGVSFFIHNLLALCKDYAS